MKTLKRKHARLCIVLLALALAFTALPRIMYSVLDLDGMLWAYLGVGGLLVCLTLALSTWSNYLRCPSCGRSLAPLRWKAGERCYCAKCGQPFVFDDEAQPGPR